MPRVERSAFVAASPERAFAFVAEPANALRWMHGFTQFDAERGGPATLGSRVQATGSVLGIPVTTTLEVVECDPPRRFSSQTTGRLKTYSTWQFEPEGPGTRIRFLGDYDVPGALLRMIGGPLVQRELETNAEKSLENLKRLLESVGR